MSRIKRKRKGTQRGMHKRMITNRKPMSTEQKEIRKKEREEQRERTKADLAKKAKK